ncbi:MAG: NAD(+)/NADH kinase [Bacteroidales bacterium]|nr:NAD(+)/NADH kinase [Bacteroidales bacterium]
MKIALYYRHIDDNDRPALDQLTATLCGKGIDTVTIHDGDTLAPCDFLFSIGGDGTLLSTVQFVRPDRPGDFPPVLGINFGHLGFLTTVGKENLYTMVEELLEGRFTLEERTLLQLHTTHSPLPTTHYPLPTPHSPLPATPSTRCSSTAPRRLRCCAPSSMSTAAMWPPMPATAPSWPPPPAPRPTRSPAAAPS